MTMLLFCLAVPAAQCGGPAHSQAYERVIGTQ